MSEDVFDQLDALLKKHAANEPEIPVLTDLVEPPRVDLSEIPVLTEEIRSEALPPPLGAERSFIPDPIPGDPVPEQAETNMVLAQLNAMEAEVQAEVAARIAQVQNEPAPIYIEVAPEIPVELPPELPQETPSAETHPEFSIEIPQHAEYVALPHTEMEAPVTVDEVQSIPSALPEEAQRSIAALIETEVARVLKDSLRQTLSAELSGMLNLTLDKALSSMLDQHMMMLEETVRSTIADELKKQLAPFKRPPPKT